MKLFIALILGFSVVASANYERTPQNATRGSEIDIAVICEYYSEFKGYNKVLCAAAQQVRDTTAPLYMPKELACLYPTIRSDRRVCSAAEVAAMELPEIPFIEGDLPYWPQDLQPVVEVVNGKAMNEALPMHEALFSNEFPVASYCIEETGTLKKTDRILCAPYVQDLALANASKVDGDPRDILIRRLKAKIDALEIELGLKPAPTLPKY